LHFTTTVKICQQQHINNKLQPAFPSGNVVPETLEDPALQLGGQK